mmetsp:Transcript_84320/g.136682  ORF Transcript_84320/g.136682 Transcript_84320/m.136682 type:complete len:158 (-) Transcript_84320:202-675(-)
MAHSMSEGLAPAMLTSRNMKTLQSKGLLQDTIIDWMMCYFSKHSNAGCEQERFLISRCHSEISGALSTNDHFCETSFYHTLKSRTSLPDKKKHWRKSTECFLNPNTSQVCLPDRIFFPINVMCVNCLESMFWWHAPRVPTLCVFSCFIHVQLLDIQY